MMKKIFPIFLSIVASAAIAYAQQSVTLNTYYPAPFGAYERIRLVPRSPLGDPCDDGTIYYDNTTDIFRFCQNGTYNFLNGVWTQNNIDPATADVYLTDPVRDINVGIGTTTPTENLTIDGGGANVVERINIGGGANSAWLRLTETNFQGGFLRYDNASNDFHIGVHDPNNTNVANDVVALTIDRGTANVGIGTTTPAEDLTIAGPGNANVAARININDTNSNSAWLRLTETNFQGGFLRYDNTSNDFHIGVHDPNNTNVANDVVALTIDRPTANVGIGTTAPTEKLSISGGGANVAARIDIANGGANSAWLRLTETNFRGGFLRYDNASNDFHIGVHDPNNTSTANDTVALTIDRPTANIGIGTTSPIAQLHVRGPGAVDVAGTAPGHIHIENSSGFLRGGKLSFASSVSPGNSIAAISGVDMGGSRSFLMFGTSNNFGAGVTNRALMIDERGNVGVNTWPSFLQREFEVTGASLFNGGPPADLNGANINFLRNSGKLLIGFNRTGGREASFIANQDNGGIPANGGFSFINYDNITVTGVTLVRMQGDGDVGIGVANPVFPLDVQGTINTRGVAPNGGYAINNACIIGPCMSDISLKEKIRPLSNSLERISRLNPVDFEFIDPKYGSGQQTGLIAQDVEKAFPEWVAVTEDGKKSVFYGMQIPMHLIQAVKELKAENERLRAEFEALKATVDQQN